MRIDDGIAWRTTLELLAGDALLSTPGEPEARDLETLDAPRAANTSRLTLGALTAFAVATTPFVLVGIPSTLWSLLAGAAVSVLTERDGLRAYWRNEIVESDPRPSILSVETAGPSRQVPLSMPSVVNDRQTPAR